VVVSVNEIQWSKHETAWAKLLTVVLLGAVLFPVRQNWRRAERRVDGFPFSYYPMFSKRRAQHANVVYAVGVLADGSRRRLRHKVLGSGGLNQIRHQLYRVALTESRANEYVAALVPRLAANPSCADLVRVEIILGEFDLDACLLARQVQGNETVLASADLVRPRATTAELAISTELSTRDLAGIPR
jgi:hypothetical protein